MQKPSENRLGTLQTIDMLLCDTNIFIEIYRNNPKTETVLKSIGIDKIAVSDVTRAELFFGAKDKRELHVICKSLNNLITLHIQQEISKMATFFVEQYCLSHRLGLPDALIAATAIYHDIELYTLNIKDFRFIPDIRLYSPEG